ncbi:MAG: hypothetical protein ABEI74_00685 [Candidatus Pacearchaeota archaeon]
MTENNIIKTSCEAGKPEYKIDPVKLEHDLEQEAMQNMGPLQKNLYLMEKRNPSMGAGAQTPIGKQKKTTEYIEGIGLIGKTEKVTDRYRTGTDFMTNQPKYEEKTNFLGSNLIKDEITYKVDKGKTI